jgi:hypothetical protein
MICTVMEWSVLPDFVGFATLRVSGNPGARNRVGMGCRTGPPGCIGWRGTPTRFLEFQHWPGHNVRDGRVRTKRLFSIFANIRSSGFDKISHNLTKFHKVSFQLHLRENNPTSLIFTKITFLFCSCLANISQKFL